jgi:rhamnose transport system permease protein
MTQAATDPFLRPPTEPQLAPVPVWRRRFFWLILRPEAVTVVLLLIAILVSTRLSSAFSFSYLLDSTSLLAEVGIIGLAMTLVIISGNIDLSVASGLALIAVVGAVLHTQYHWHMGAVIPFSLVLGLALGLLNGLLVTKVGLPSLTATLGTFALYRGLAQILLADQSISKFPNWYKGIDHVWIAGAIPLPLIILLLLAVAFALLLHKTVFGRCVYAIGTNEPAALFAGVRVNRIKLAVFALSGLMMGLGAVMEVSREGASYNLAKGGELLVITAVVLGGTSIFGGSGSIFGTVAALLLLCVLKTGMDLAVIGAEKQLAVTGSLLIVSVLLTNLTAGVTRSLRK